MGEGESQSNAGEPADGAAAQERTYESAVERLEQIIERLDSGQAGLRETLDLCREGRDLVTFCAAELDAVGADLAELRLDELAAGLERTPTPDPSSSQAQS